MYYLGRYYWLMSHIITSLCSLYMKMHIWHIFPYLFDLELYYKVSLLGCGNILFFAAADILYGSLYWIQFTEDAFALRLVLYPIRLCSL